MVPIFLGHPVHTVWGIVWDTVVRPGWWNWHMR